MFTLPGDKSSQDQLTPYRCSLLILIKEYAHIYDEKKPFPEVIWQETLTSKRHLDRALLSWIQQPDGSLKDILRTVTFCSKALHSGFMTMLDDICNYESIGSLENFFFNLDYVIFQEEDSLLNKEGLLGLFCRRMLIYYKRLSFCEIQPFFDNFIKYCSPHVSIKQPISERIPKIPKGGLEDGSEATVEDRKEAVTDMELESQSEMDSKSSRESMDDDLKPSDLKTEKCDEFEASEYFSHQQAEYFFSQQAALIETKESDALSPAALQCKIRQALKSNPELTHAHYVSYLNNLRLKEFCGAMDSMFMYFIRHNKKSSLPANELHEKECNRTQRFATLNLALLHSRFGHKKAALAAVKESINLSQISNDTVCLQHAMALLNHLQPGSNTHQVATEIIKPGKKQTLAELAYYTVQAHMNHLSISGKRPSFIFRNLATVDAFQCTKPLSHFASTSFAHKASLWRMYGKRQMALLHAQLALSMQSALDKKSYTCPSRYNSEDIALCLCHVADILNEEGSINSCIDLLNHAKIRFPQNSRHSHYWRKTEARLNHQLHLRLSKPSEAVRFQQVLMSHDKTEAMLREAETLATREEYFKSHSILLKILRQKENSDFKEELKPEIECQIYLLMGDLLSHNKSDQATSLRYLLEALSISRINYLHGFANEALLKIAQLQLHSNSPQISLTCLKSITFECYANGTLHSRSRLLLVAVRCLMKSSSNYDVEDIDKFIDALLSSQVGFEKTQDISRQRDAAYLLAKLCDLKSKCSKSDESRPSKQFSEAIRMRDEFACEFKRLDIQLGCLKYSVLI